MKSMSRKELSSTHSTAGPMKLEYKTRKKNCPRTRKRPWNSPALCASTLRHPDLWGCDDYGSKLRSGRGPVQQLCPQYRSIVQQEITITRLAVTSEKDAERKDGKWGANTSYPMPCTGSKGMYLLPWPKNWFSTADLDLFWEALINMFDHDRSAARGKWPPQALRFPTSERPGQCPSPQAL